MNIVERIVRVVFKGVDDVSDATRSASGGITGFVNKIPGWAQAAAVLAGAYQVIAGAVNAAKQFVMNSIAAYDTFSASQRKLEGTAKLTGVALAELQEISKNGTEGFKLSTVTANDFAAEIAKLTSKAGDLTKSKDAMSAFLDIGAARGLSAGDTLKAVQQAILGIDEGTDKLFGKNPSVLYEEYADKIGKSAGKLSDQEKAMALLDATMEGGSRVRGSYAEYLNSAAGLQEQLNTKMENAQTEFGKALQPIRTLVLQGLVKLVEIGTPVVLAIGRVSNAIGVTLGVKFHEARQAVGGFAEVLGRLTRSESLEAWGKAQVLSALEAKNAIYLMQAATESAGRASVNAGQQARDAAATIADAAHDNAENTTVSVDRMSKAISEKLGGPMRNLIGMTEGAIRSLASAANEQLPPAVAREFERNMARITDHAVAVEERITRTGAELKGRAEPSTRDMARGLETIARGALDAMEAFGVIDDHARRTLTSVLNIATSMGQLLGGNIAAGVAGFAGGIANLVAALSNSENKRLVKENTDQMRKLREEGIPIDASISGDDVAGLSGALTRALAKGPIQTGLALDSILRNELQKSGMTLGDLNRIAEELDFNIKDSKGNYQANLVQQLLNYLNELERAPTYGDDYASRLRALRDSFSVHGTKDPEQLAALAQLAGEFSPALAGVFDPNDLQQSRGRLQMLFEDLRAGRLNVNELGGMSSSQFLALLQDMIGRIDSLSAAGTDPAADPPDAPADEPKEDPEAARREARQAALDALELKILQAESVIDTLKRQDQTDQTRAEIEHLQEMITGFRWDQDALRRRFRMEDLTGVYGPDLIPVSLPPLPLSGGIGIPGSVTDGTFSGGTADPLRAILTESRDIQRETLGVLTTSLERHTEAVEWLRILASQNPSRAAALTLEDVDAYLEERRRSANLSRGRLPSAV